MTTGENCALPKQVAKRSFTKAPFFFSLAQPFTISHSSSVVSLEKGPSPGLGLAAIRPGRTGSRRWREI